MRFVRAESRNLSEKEWTEIVGRKPIEDDLERTNCPKVGMLGHESCGWNACKNRPIFMGREHEENCSCPDHLIHKDPFDARQ